MKGYLTSLVIVTSVLEPQHDTVSQLQQWLKWEVNHMQCWWGWRLIRTLTHCGRSAKCHNYFGKQFLIKLNIYTPYNPEISLLGVYPRDNKNCVNPKICLWMFMACQFTRPPDWKQPRCPWASECLSKLQCIHTMRAGQYYLAVKRNDVSIRVTTWVSPESIMVRERHYIWMCAHHMVSLI